MKLTSQTFADNAWMPGRCTFAVPDDEAHVRLADNLNPQLAWEDVPRGTKSFAVLCIDPDAPTRPDDVNQVGRTVPASLPRADFVHWTLVDLPGDTTQIAEGACSRGVTPHGKSTPPGPPGCRQGQNDYTAWFQGDPDMEGTWLGYDGPCPPWNDERAHHYRFEVLALDLQRCAVSGAFTAADVRTATQGHVLAHASLTGRYTLNPAVRSDD